MTVATERVLKGIEWLVLLVGAGLMLFTMHGSGDSGGRQKFEWFGIFFVLWPISPYVVYGLVTRRVERASPYVVSVWPETPVF